MFQYYLILGIIGLQVILIHAHETDKISLLDVNNSTERDKNTVHLMKNETSNEPKEEEKVKVQLFYECLCPYSISFAIDELHPTVHKLGQHLDLHIYPYGNAKTTEHDGHYKFDCQHGPDECYGNKLHACAVDLLRDTTESLDFNVCMMNVSFETNGSDDATADMCGKSMSINSENIKQCAKSDKGTQLLKYYGEESKKVGFRYVPYVLINGVHYRYEEGSENKLLKAVCAAFKNPPPQCHHEKELE